MPKDTKNDDAAPTGPSPEDVAKFSQAVQEDITTMLAQFGLKIAVVHAPIVVPLTQSEAQRAKEIAEHKMKQAVQGDIAPEQELAALRTALSAATSNASNYLGVLKHMTQKWLETLADAKNPPSIDTPPDAKYPH